MNRKQRRATAAGPAITQEFVDTFNLALQLHEAGQLEQAELIYRKAMQMNPNHGLLHSNLGVLHYAQGKTEEAIVLHKKAIRLDPGLGIAYNNLGVAYNRLEQHEEAVEAFRKAIEIEPTNSRALNNMGDSLTKSGRFEESLTYLERAMQIDTAYPEAMSNKGMALWGMGDLEGAVEWLRKSIKLQPNLPTVHKNLGLVLLLKGDLNEAWVEYNYRLASEGAPMRGGGLPIWTGQNLGAGALYVFSEQGVGDELLYSSMIRDLTALGIDVIWEADPRLVKLLERSFDSVRFVARTSPPSLVSPAHDAVAQLPAGTVGQLFRRSLEHFPKDTAGYLKPDVERSAALRASLGLAPGEKLIGMSWVSKNAAFGRHKSTTLADWAEIMKTPGVRFVDLQYGDTAEERAALKKKHGVTLAHVDGLDLKDDIDGMAALTAACDMVITVSNTTAHVAGALGIPTWVLVHIGGGKLWYWGTKETTPWYPTISIIRQVTRDDWSSTLRLTTERMRAHFNL